MLKELALYDHAKYRNNGMECNRLRVMVTVSLQNAKDSL